MELGHSLIKPEGTMFKIFKHPDRNYLLGCKEFATDGPGIFVSGRGHACVVDTNRDGMIDATMFKNRDRLFPVEAPVKYKKVSVGKTNKSLKSNRRLIYNGYYAGVLRIKYSEFYMVDYYSDFTEVYSINVSSSESTDITVNTVELTVKPTGESGLTYTIRSGFEPSSGLLE
jgi:hypothetical protein